MSDIDRRLQPSYCILEPRNIGPAAGYSEDDVETRGQRRGNMDAALTGALRPSLLQKTKQTRNGGKNMEGMTHSKRKLLDKM